MWLLLRLSDGQTMISQATAYLAASIFNVLGPRLLCVHWANIQKNFAAIGARIASLIGLKSVPGKFR
jgi:hypothetical protein